MEDELRFKIKRTLIIKPIRAYFTKEKADGLK